MRTGKHTPARFSHYVRAHLRDLEQLAHSGFIQPDHGAEFMAVPGGFLLDAAFDCEGGILVHARKLARIVSDTEGGTSSTWKSSGTGVSCRTLEEL